MDGGSDSKARLVSATPRARRTRTTTTIAVFPCELQWPTKQWEERWGTYCGSTGEAAWAMTKDCTVAWPGRAEATALSECREFVPECVIFDTNREKCGRTRASTTSTTTTTTTGTNTTTTTTTNATTTAAAATAYPGSAKPGFNTTQLFLSLDVDNSGRVTYLDLSA